MTLNGPAANVLAGRRDAVLEALRETRAVLVLPAVVESVYSADVHYPYRTASNIRYLTGFEEPAAVILSASGRDDGFTLLVNPRDPVAETWTGRRAGIEGAGFTVKPGDTPIVPIMLGDARLATQLADALLEDKIYVIGFSYPVVPKGQARIRVQLSAAHSEAQIDQAIEAFTRRGRELGILSA